MPMSECEKTRELKWPFFEKLVFLTLNCFFDVYSLTNFAKYY